MASPLEWLVIATLTLVTRRIVHWIHSRLVDGDDGMVTLDSVKKAMDKIAEEVGQSYGIKLPELDLDGEE